MNVTNLPATPFLDAAAAFTLVCTLFLQCYADAIKSAPACQKLCRACICPMKYCAKSCCFSFLCTNLHLVLSVHHMSKLYSGLFGSEAPGADVCALMLLQTRDPPACKEAKLAGACLTRKFVVYY